VGFAFTVVIRYFANHGLRSYLFIGVGWLLHTACGAGWIAHCGGSFRSRLSRLRTKSIWCVHRDARRRAARAQGVQVLRQRVVQVGRRGSDTNAQDAARDPIPSDGWRADTPDMTMAFTPLAETKGIHGAKEHKLTLAAPKAQNDAKQAQAVELLKFRSGK
jgi:Family of unknown function (DUF6010)